MRSMWLAEPLSDETERALRRLERTQGVVAIAVMPDAHLSKQVCVGTVTTTSNVLIPDAVGGDIGCGMAAMRFDVEAEAINQDKAGQVLARLSDRIPILRHRRNRVPVLPAALSEEACGDATIDNLRRRQAALQFGTLGRGNHFVELQRDEEGFLWAMVHSGSRGIGPAIRDRFLRAGKADPGSRIVVLRADEPAGTAYLSCAQWARSYARKSREFMMGHVAEILSELLAAKADESTRIDADHNHVQLEAHGKQQLWVHRKGAQSAREGEPGIIPGTMGTASYHVVGRGHVDALTSSSHGAGRAMHRTKARSQISPRQLQKEMRGVWFDERFTERLVEEAPSAYKSITRVMRAQKALVKIVRRLEPVLVYKGA
jgi:tRNA-splicing ligase RtcB